MHGLTPSANDYFSAILFSSKMTLPNEFENAYSNINLTMDFLHDYQWLYNFRNTHIFAEGVLEKFPQDWVDFLDTLDLDELKQLIDTCPAVS